MVDDQTALTSYFSSHFVGLSWIDRTPGERANANGGEGTPIFASAFIVERGGRWLLLTAGHILKGIQDALACGQKLVNWQLHDGLAVNPKHSHPIPFPMESAQAWHWCDDDGINAGADYGIIILGPLEVALLKENDKKPIAHGWNRELPGFDHYCLFGLPAEFQRSRVSAAGFDVQIAQTMIPVKRINPTPEMLSKIPRFYGRIPYPLLGSDGADELTDIDGMSGGPIFGLRETERGMECSVVAIQSAWNKSSRTIVGCLLKPLAEELIRRAHVEDAVEHASRDRSTRPQRSEP